MKQITSQSSRSTMQAIPEINTLVRCSLILIQTYVSRFKVTQGFFEKYLAKRPFAEAEARFDSLIQLLIPEKIEIVVDTILNFFQKEHLWRVECVCSKIFNSLLSSRASPEFLFHKILDYIEETITIGKAEESRHLVHILFSIITEDYFSNFSTDGVTRLLKLYNLSVQLESNKFHLIRMGFSTMLIKLMCTINAYEVSKIFQTILHLTFQSSLTQSECKEFGSTILHGVSRMRVNSISENLQPEYLKFLLTVMVSPCYIKSILAARFLAILVDHQNNLGFFDTPVIFHENTNYNIKVASAAGADKQIRGIFEEYRSLFETSIIILIKLHCSKREALNAVYGLMCVIITNVPSHYTIVFIVCILMNLQRYLLAETQNLNHVQVNHVHSVISSIMMLVCWVTRAKSLSKYIHNIVNLRYDAAPHFNPPLNYFYEYADHHILYNKQELFFNSWELRYCLWKRFRLNEDLLPEINDQEQNLESSSRIFKLFQKKPKKIYKLKLNQNFQFIN